MIEELLINLIANLVTSLVLTTNHDINVGNLELETDHDYLLENGGFILLE